MFSYLLIFFLSKNFAEDLEKKYQQNFSQIWYDRNGEILQILTNGNENFSLPLEKIPEKFQKLLLQKEDQYFFYHFGINPVSTLRAVGRKIFKTGSTANSTITQQLAKILLQNEFDRSFKNKILESWAAVALELHFSKQEILTMYCNSIFFGNRVVGVNLAAKKYFQKSPQNLSNSEILQLLATISSPSLQNPFQKKNILVAKKISQNLNLEISDFHNFSQNKIKTLEKIFNDFVSDLAVFEINSLQKNKSKNNQKFTIDKILNQKIRKVLEKNLQNLASKNVKNAAAVVIKFPENEILAAVGSPDPTKNSDEKKINMLTVPRPIGSTIKPFVFALGFEKGLRPYSLVEDREYAFKTAENFAFYPKNYDLKYYGIVDLHYSLSNSLNIAVVKILEFLGGSQTLEDFFKNRFNFTPLQDATEYGLSMVLGGMEISPLQLAHFFSVFGQFGNLKSLKITTGENIFPGNKKIFDPEIVQLINRVLIDRETGVDQFSISNNLIIPGNKNIFAIKTGTSREFHDSWTVGFYPDFLVLVWVGNAENSGMENVSGAVGAGKIWNKIAQILINSQYFSEKSFNFSNIKNWQDEEKISFGFFNDNFEKSKNLLLDFFPKTKIIFPHDGDEFKFFPGVEIPITASENCQFFINSEKIFSGKKTFFSPSNPGKFEILFQCDSGKSETISIFFR